MAYYTIRIMTECFKKDQHGMTIYTFLKNNLELYSHSMPWDTNLYHI